MGTKEKNELPTKSAPTTGSAFCEFCCMEFDPNDEGNQSGDLSFCSAICEDFYSTEYQGLPVDYVSAWEPNAPYDSRKNTGGIK